MALIDNRDDPPAVPRWATVLLVVSLVLAVALGLGSLSQGRWLGVLVGAALAFNSVTLYLGVHRRVAAARAQGDRPGLRGTATGP